MSLITTMLESSCVINRPRIGRDANQGVTQKFVQVSGVIACSVQETNPSVKLLYAQRNAEVDTDVHFAEDPGVQANDQLVVTDRTGKTAYYLCQGESQPVGRGRIWLVRALRVEAPT